MPDFMKKLACMVLPFWMDRGEPLKLLRAARKFWLAVYGWLTWPVSQFDPLTCAEPLLNLMAYDRDITRFDGEPLGLFRKRVAYAFVNAADAGSVEGFRRIFRRLGIGLIDLQERQPDIDWDIVVLRVTDGQSSRNPQLLLQIIQQYGRTCRRYQFEVITAENLAIRAGWDQGEYVCYPARLAGTENASATFSASIRS